MISPAKKIIGREEERKILSQLSETSEPHFVTLIGRRRVGKTFLIRKTFEGQLHFEITGIQNASKQEQLVNFVFALKQYFPKLADDTIRPTSWVEAFEILIMALNEIKGKKILFMDELPWLDGHKSGFMKGLSFFWNSWASKNNALLITCGSAASWMMQKIVNNKGGLHNRVTRRIMLQPFTLVETREYLDSRNILLNSYQIVQLYMAIGGIPYYLSQIEKGKSVPQIIEDLFLSKNAPLVNEFDNLYASLFNNHQRYLQIVEACYTKWKGLTHAELVALTQLKSGGTLTKMIKDLELSGFIKTVQPIDNKKKNTLIRLVDEYSIFYLKFLSDGRNKNWQAISKSQSFNIWQGFAFENICFKNIDSIKKALGISGVSVQESSYQQQGTSKKKGVQIDLLLDRADQIVNLCEIKFYNQPFVISKMHYNQLQDKIKTLQFAIPKKSIHLCIISTYGLKPNLYSSTVQREITLDDFF